MRRNGARPSRGKQMVRNDHWAFDRDLEGVRSLGAALIDPSFVLPQQGVRSMLGLYWFRGCKGLQPGLQALQGQKRALEL